MNIFFEHKINSISELKVIHIADNEKFISDFELRKPFHFDKKELSNKRKKEIIAQYALIANMIKSDEFELKYEPSGRPQLWTTQGQKKISISHSGDFVAVLLSDSEFYGVDIQMMKPKITNLAQKFLNNSELRLLESIDEEDLTKTLTACWCAKETLYKMYGKGFIDYQNLFIIKELAIHNTNKINVQATFDNIVHQFELYMHSTHDFVLVYYS